MRALIATAATPDDRKTLCLVRSLASRGVAVTVGGDCFHGQAFWSRYAAGRLRYAHPATAPERFVEDLARLLDSRRYDVLIPSNDYTTIAVASQLSVLEPLVHAATPSIDSINLALDKLELMRIGASLGLDVPATRSLDRDQRIAPEFPELAYPRVLKPRRGAGAVGVSIARNAGEYEAFFAREHPASDSVFDHDCLLAQEYVPGEIHDVCLLFNHGEARAALTQRRLRMYPAAGGIGIYCETTDEPELAERAVSLLKKLKWHGPAQVEFKVDGGRAWLIEVNGRLWGTLDLSVRAGVDFPWLLFCLARDGDVAPVHRYEAGLRYRWPFPLGMLHSLECGEPFSALWDFIGPARGARSDIRWSDPLPHVAEMADIARRAWKRRSIRPGRGMG